MEPFRKENPLPPPDVALRLIKKDNIPGRLIYVFGKIDEITKELNPSELFVIITNEVIYLRFGEQHMQMPVDQLCHLASSDMRRAHEEYHITLLEDDLRQYIKTLGRYRDEC